MATKTKSVSQDSAAKCLEDSILNYGDKIVTISDLVKGIRELPGHYIGYIGARGYLNMIREIFQNALDEAVKEDSPGTYAYIFFDERSNKCVCIDDGRGLPFTHIIRIFTQERTSSNYTKKKGEYSSGRHGIGSKATNALSKYFDVESYVNIPGVMCEGRHVLFSDGYPSKKGEETIPNKEKRQGSIITFEPCYEILGNFELTCREVFDYLKQMLYPTKLGTKIMFEGITKDGNSIKEAYTNDRGIEGYLIDKCPSPLVQPIHITFDTGEILCDVAFTFNINAQEPDVISFGNYSPTIGGTHVDGFTKAVVDYFRKYMNNIYLNGNKKKLQVVNKDIVSNIVAVVSGCLLKPTFTGQAKDMLGNEEMAAQMYSVVLAGLEEWGRTKQADLAKVSKFLKDLAEIRTKSDDSKIKLNTKYQASSVTGLPDKYIRAKNKTNLELWLCEGSSAASGMRNNRNILNQSIFPIEKSYMWLFRAI